MTMTDDLKTLLEAAKRIRSTPAQREELRRSFAFGNTALENDRIAREMVDRQAEKLAERIPGAELTIFPKLRHGFNIEDPDAVNERLLTFLAKHSAVGVA